MGLLDPDLVSDNVGDHVSAVSILSQIQREYSIWGGVKDKTALLEALRGLLDRGHRYGTNSDGEVTHHYLAHIEALTLDPNTNWR